MTAKLCADVQVVILTLALACGCSPRSDSEVGYKGITWGAAVQDVKARFPDMSDSQVSPEQCASAIKWAIHALHGDKVIGVIPSGAAYIPMVAYQSQGDDGATTFCFAANQLAGVSLTFRGESSGVGTTRAPVYQQLASRYGNRDLTPLRIGSYPFQVTAWEPNQAQLVVYQQGEVGDESVTYFERRRFVERVREVEARHEDSEKAAASRLN